MARYAICMGINDYPGVDNDLAQCLKDRDNMAERLRQVGFIVTDLADSEATTRNFTEHAKRIISMLKVGDDFVITYSGHGSYQLDQDGDEADGYDEVICLHDRDFTDDEFRALLATIPAGVNTTIILDSCFSGSATRAHLGGKIYRVRFRPPKAPLIPYFPKKKNFLKSPTDDQESMNHILLSGCNNEQYSYETPDDGGAFTNALSKILDKVGFEGDVSFADFQEQIKGYLPSRNYPQNPQVEGAVVNKKKVLPFFKKKVATEEPPTDEEESSDPNDGQGGGCLKSIAGGAGVLIIMIYLLFKYFG